jgi:hypothetical protein
MMEATSDYWKPVFYRLEAEGFECVLADATQGRWKTTSQGTAGCGLSRLVTLCGEYRGGAGMSEPVTFSVLGGWAALEGIKFLYGQAAEVLKAWRDRRSQAPPAQLVVPIMATEVLDGTPGSR